MKKKGIIGAGGFGREVYWSLPLNERISTVFFVDDEYYNGDNPLILPLSNLNTDEYEVIVAIGDPIDRKKIVESLPRSTKYFTHIHSSVIILDPNVEIGEGSIICANSVLTTNIKLGKHCHLNLLTTIGHDCLIGDFFTTAPGVKISGNCNISNCVYFGTNSSIKQKINICENVIIGMNAAVVKNIDEPGIYTGIPSKKLIK
jgi:sugar O-acyltransferase (sialic acid O-acetyltransferase NeuD family)